jgi:uncharacterized protein YhbP (UPF0306 family)
MPREPKFEMSIDEPLFGEGPDAETFAAPDPAVREHIARLVETQPYGVLCVQGGGQPYGALVAFAFSRDLRHAVFTTPLATRKYKLLSECDRVALVVDNRSRTADDLMQTEAVTVTGRASWIDRGDEFDRWAGLLVSRHAYLKSFVEAPSCALFRIDVVRYLHVVRFQEVSQWVPNAPS